MALYPEHLMFGAVFDLWKAGGHLICWFLCNQQIFYVRRKQLPSRSFLYRNENWVPNRHSRGIVAFTTFGKQNRVLLYEPAPTAWIRIFRVHILARCSKRSMQNKRKISLVCALQQKFKNNTPTQHEWRYHISRIDIFIVACRLHRWMVPRSSFNTCACIHTNLHIVFWG